MNRRDFLLAAAATSAAGAVAASDAPAMTPVVDTHQHLIDVAKVRPPWVKPGSFFDHPFTSAEYATATAGLNVVKAVYMEVDVAPADKQAEADYIVELCRAGKTPTCAAVVGGLPASDGFARYVTPFKGHKFIKGIRQVLHGDAPAGTGLSPEFVKGLQLLGELGLSFDLCIRPGELPDFDKLVGLCPGTRFILDHCGNPQAKFTKPQLETWKTDLGAIAGRKNLVCKVSGVVANGYESGKWTADDLAPAVNHVLDSFGPDRVLFGGDWPVCTQAATYKEWLSVLQVIVAPRSAGDRSKLFHDNAVKFYGLA